MKPHGMTIDDKDPEHRGDSRNQNGTAIHMTSGVHCCECWRYSDDREVDERRLSVAVDVLQTNSLKGTPAFDAALAFIAQQLADAR